MPPDAHLYVSDETQGEGRWRIRTTPRIAARMRCFAFNILKANRFGTLTQDRYRVALGGPENLPQLLAIS